MNSCRVGHPRASHFQPVLRRQRIGISAQRVPCKRYTTIVRSADSNGEVDPAHKQRENELVKREDQLWQRMQLLLDREAELREQEVASANRREAHLQSQVDMLLSIISNNQSEKSLPPGSVGSTNQRADAPPPRIADVLQTMQQSAANLSHGTFAEGYNGGDQLDAIDQAIEEGPRGQQHAASMPPPPYNNTATNQVTPQERPSFAQELQGVVDGVLQGTIDPMEDMDALRMPDRQGSSESSAATSATPTPPTTPVQPSSASAHGGAVPASIADAMTSAAAATSAGGAADGPVETEKAPKEGPPPMLNIGDDDIFWVAALHKGLLAGGCYCGEDDEADFFFGAGTQAAVMTYQALNKLPETGLADDATWQSLGIRTGADVAPAADASSAAKNPAEDGIIWQQGDGSGAAVGAKDPAEEGVIWQQGDTAPAAAGGAFGGLFDGLGVKAKNGEGQGSSSDEGSGAEAPGRIMSAKRREVPQYTKWPVLRENDGERAVHTLHVMLQQQGFHPDEEDTKWWMFGPTTVSALTTFQACSGLPESGVCDVATWRALLGDSAKPEDIDLVFSGDSDDEDMDQISDGRVYLIGEQRWSKY